jgi:hypothetical protein
MSVYLLYSSFFVFLSFAQSQELTAELPKAEKPFIRYRITKKFHLRALTDLYTLQFKFPLSRKDIPNQEMTDLETSPKANALVNDPDGNRIAIFYFSNLRGGEEKNIEICYKVKIEQENKDINFSTIPDNYSELTPDLERYLKREENIDMEDELIQKTLNSIVGEIKNPYLKGKAIYDFIVANIKYENKENFSGLQRSKETLIQKRGNCADITKLFIVLARACGIPTRQVDGLVFFPNVSPTKGVEKIGHAWAEIYLPVYGWLPVDPTFGISQKEEYYCFKYNKHIREFFGQVISRNPGSLYSGSSIQVRTYNPSGGVPVDKDAEIEIELLNSKITINAEKLVI